MHGGGKEGDGKFWLIDEAPEALSSPRGLSHSLFILALQS